MKVEVLKHVRQLFSSQYAPKEINRANQRKWVAARRQLGDKWLLAQPVGRKAA